ncbi:hypothetical protein BDC45DRAFT_306097 [Circinella umbellata]|nr:hypothetical protein BDC45DRAFT_306097 [Circinella umbellata]
MDDGNKWELREGVFVEDIMYEYGKNCTHEHAAHSFILNTSDPCWENVFSKEDFKKICTEGNYRLPKLDDNIIDMFAHYHDSPETNVLDFIIKKSKDLGPFDPRYEVDQYKLLHVIQQFIGYYVDNTMANITMWTEQDFVAHIWCVLDRFFQSSGITTTRNKTCLATAQRMNGNRCVTGDSEINKKLRSTQPDLVLLKNGVEYGTSEVGKSIDIVAGKKEIVESQLHSPKTMHDMLCAAHKRMNNDFNSVRDLKIVCFNETGLTLYLSIMDCPKGYVSRIIETQKYEVPKDSDLIIGQLFPLLKLILHAKVYNLFTGHSKMFG